MYNLTLLIIINNPIFNITKNNQSTLPDVYTLDGVLLTEGAKLFRFERPATALSVVDFMNLYITLSTIKSSYA